MIGSYLVVECVINNFPEVIANYDINGYITLWIKHVEWLYVLDSNQ